MVDFLLSMLTDCGLWVRKSQIQLQKGVQAPRSRSLEISLIGMMMKVELESLSSRMLSVSLLSKYSRDE